MERHKIVHCFDSGVIAANEDIFNGSPASDVIHMDHYRECTFVVIKNAGGTGTATATVLACDDATPSSTQAVAFKYRTIDDPDTHGAWTDATSSGISISAGADEIWEFRVLASGLYSTYEYVRLNLAEVDSTAVDGGAFAILTDPRYVDSDPDTAGSDAD